LNYFFEESGFHPLFFFSLLYLVLCHYIFGMLFGGFGCLTSFPVLIFVLWLTLLLARLMCYLTLVWGCNLALISSQAQCQTSF
jgi:hypothetical protein